MNSEKRHIERWLKGGMLMLLLMLVACSSGSTEEPTQKPRPESNQKPVLQLYLFAPESPIVTRASGDNVASKPDEEKRINKLQVWVFIGSTDNLVSYIELTGNDLSDLQTANQKTITMDITEEFAARSPKPNVDVFVAANVTEANSGLALSRTTTATQLKEAKLGTDYFGLWDGESSSTNDKRVQAVPTDGLPMSGRLLNQEIEGMSPVFSLKSKSNVKLMRAISKLRFVFCISGSDDPGVMSPVINNLDIKLGKTDKLVLPKEEYLFLENAYYYPDYIYHVGTTYVNPASDPSYLVKTAGKNEIVKWINPIDFIYDGQSGQDYENLIDLGVNGDNTTNPVTPIKLTEIGRFYLRESDRQLEGEISYDLGETEPFTHKTVTFAMMQALDFTRNHTWIVYGYFMASGDLRLNLVDVKNWKEENENPEVYNW